jgi:uncharacterized membrane protein
MSYVKERMFMIFFHHGPSPLMLLFGGLSSLIWLLILVMLILALIRWLSSRNTTAYPYMHMPPTPGTPPNPNQPSAMEILRRRYARGEIDAETFDRMRERLEASHDPNPPSHS